MDEQLSLLIQLQEIDGKIRSLREQKKRLPEFLADLERKREANKKNLESVKEELQAAQKNKRDRDLDLDAGVQKVEKLKARTSEIKNNKEYQALLKEIEIGERENKAIEDDILVLMEKIDATAAKIASAEQRSKEEEAVLQSEQMQREADFSKMEEELKGLEGAWQEVVARVKPDILVQYQKLLSTKAGVAITEVRGESCSGCYMSIPPQIFVNVKKNESIITCPNCHRMLYYKEAIVPK
ncbi:MAG TPA: C4-type zinc ribbon domain-containing protein [Nitrospirota bacterium]|nr:C4-type zinc ribbon domain-containing protein [Nitrospirota bacterium]